MDMKTRNIYLETIIATQGYHSKLKKEKTAVLNEYCKNTKQNRKYVIHKISCGSYSKYTGTELKKRNRKCIYDSQTVKALIKCWKIFDYPCGLRLEPLLKIEVDHLRILGELDCSDETAKKLKQISFRTIDGKLNETKKNELLKIKYCKRINPLLYQKIPVKLSYEQDRSNFGLIQIDLVEHCGQSAAGEFINTLSTTDIASSWWEGAGAMGRSQRNVFLALEIVKERYPLNWKEIHSDNGTEFINNHLYNYVINEKIGFTRSRPYKKNDNYLVEQKNWTHVKKYTGYLRYDTQEELKTLNCLYEHLGLYKNYFQPVIKLESKERINGKIIRRYNRPQTPYQYLINSKETPILVKKKLEKIYKSLNPAQLKRNIDDIINKLYWIYRKKKGSENINLTKKIKPVMVRKLIA